MHNKPKMSSPFATPDVPCTNDTGTKGGGGRVFVQPGRFLSRPLLVLKEREGGKG